MGCTIGKNSFLCSPDIVIFVKGCRGYHPWDRLVKRNGFAGLLIDNGNKSPGMPGWLNHEGHNYPGIFCFFDNHDMLKLIS
jgi:hypothetical protein